MIVMISWLRNNNRQQRFDFQEFIKGALHLLPQN